MLNTVTRKIIMTVAAIVFLFSAAMVLRYHLQMQASIKCAEAIMQMAVTMPTKQPEQMQAIDENTNEVADTIPIQVDFEILCQQNQDVIAWIYCPDTPINYPIVQADDNEYYLHHLLDGRYNTAGTLFMDCQNSADFSDWNSIIYGHNMKNDSMFGTLPDYKEQSYFEEHPVIFLLTPEQNYKINPLAGFVVPADSQLYGALNPSEEERELLIREWMNCSDFDSVDEVFSKCNLITLSTCSYEYSNARYVVVGVLEKF